MLRDGIPRHQDVKQLLETDFYREHLQANRDFLSRHGPALAGYGRHWGQDPYKLWSRRWEYPWVAQAVLDQLRTTSGPVRMLDAGSGVTYLPYYLCAQVPELTVVCADYDNSYIPMFDAINRNVGHERVTFSEASLQQLPFESHSFDVVACVSVLEHTDQYTTILDEFNRVLKPGGSIVLTFDLSLDDKFELNRSEATALLKHLANSFSGVNESELLTELKAIDNPADLLSTDRVKQESPELLPWRWPMLKAVRDMVKGHGWTGGFRSKSVYCVRATSKVRSTVST